MLRVASAETPRRTFTSTRHLYFAIVPIRQHTPGAAFYAGPPPKMLWDPVAGRTRPRRYLRKAHQKPQGPFLSQHYPASTVIRPRPTPAMTAAFRDVEAATLALDGSPPITRTTFPTCRAHYPGGSSGCACRLLPRSCCLPLLTGGSASALGLSRPAQASLTLRPAGLLNRLSGLCHEAPALPVTRPNRSSATRSNPTTLGLDPSSTSDPRLRGARSTACLKLTIIRVYVEQRTSPGPARLVRGSWAQ